MCYTLWGFSSWKIMIINTATVEANSNKLLDELIDLLIDARHKNGVGLKNLDVGISNDYQSVDILEYSVRLTLVKYK